MYLDVKKYCSLCYGIAYFPLRFQLSPLSFRYICLDRQLQYKSVFYTSYRNPYTKKEQNSVFYLQVHGKYISHGFIAEFTFTEIKDNASS